MQHNDDFYADLMTDDEDELPSTSVKDYSSAPKSIASTRRINQRFSVTQFDINSILEQKRALREKNSNKTAFSKSSDKNSNGVDERLKHPFRSATPERRTFAHSFSPTLYTPPREERFNEDFANSVSFEIGKFLKLILSIDINALQMDYSEDLVTYHLRNNSMFPLEMTHDQLPLTYNSFKEYKDTYFPYIFYDVWAQLVEEYYSNLCSGYLKVFLHSVDTTTDPEIYTLSLRCVIPSAKIHFDEFSIENWLALVQLDFKPSICNDNVNPTSDSSEKLKKLKAIGFVHSYNKLNGTRSHRIMPPHLPVLGRPDDEKENFYSYTECEYEVKLYANPNSRELIKNQKYLTIKPIYYIRPTIRYIETISLMKFKDGFQQTFLKPDKDVSSLDFNQPEDFYFYEESHFNEQQKKAILACYNAIKLPYNKNRIVPIQGPPGTGKTHTLVGIVKNMFINCKHGSEKPLRILICAPSNGAIDEIALRLIQDRDFLKEFKDTGLSLVRIGQRSQVHPEVKSFLLEHMVENNYKFCRGSRPKSDLRDDLLKNAHVILSTLNSVQLTCMSLFRKEFTTTKTAIRCVIVDEASQSTEPELLMPLIYPISKLILIGDHLQLPATIISRYALRKGYGRSMFERLFLNYEEMSSRIPGFTNPMITLQRQFRMNHAICHFPSTHFYRSLLETPVGTGQNQKIPIKPYLVFDVTNANERSTSYMMNSSKFNVEEAECIFKLLLVIFSKLGFVVTPERIVDPPEKLDISIGIITFYRGQRLELINRLQKFDNGVLLNYLDVNTVDAFQGQERDIVILSCVRAFETNSDINSVGFVRSQQRMNVALTRAKSVLFVMIHAKSFINVPRWQQLLTEAQRRNCFKRLTSLMPFEMLMKEISLK